MKNLNKLLNVFLNLTNTSLKFYKNLNKLLKLYKINSKSYNKNTFQPFLEHLNPTTKILIFVF